MKANSIAVKTTSTRVNFSDKPLTSELSSESGHLREDSLVFLNRPRRSHVHFRPEHTPLALHSFQLNSGGNASFAISA